MPRAQIRARGLGGNGRERGLPGDVDHQITIAVGQEGAVCFLPVLDGHAEARLPLVAAQPLGFSDAVVAGEVDCRRGGVDVVRPGTQRPTVVLAGVARDHLVGGCDDTVVRVVGRMHQHAEHLGAGGEFHRTSRSFGGRVIDVTHVVTRPRLACHAPYHDAIEALVLTGVDVGHGPLGGAGGVLRPLVPLGVAEAAAAGRLDGCRGATGRDGRQCQRKRRQ